MKKRPDRKKLLSKVDAKFTKKTNRKFPEFKPGDTVKVFVNVREGEKTRVQPFEGVVLGMKSAGTRSNFTVRKMASGVGVERTFPLSSPVIDKIMLVSKGEVRRAKLYYLRELRGRKGRIRSEYVYEDTQTIEEPVAASESSETEAKDAAAGSEVEKEAAQA